MSEPQQNIQEKELLIRVAAGNEDAFRELFQNYHGKLYGYIYKMTESREAAEDTVHDVFLKIWETRETVTGINNLNAYLHRMAHNQTYSGFRRMAKETLILAELKSEQQETTTSEAAASDHKIRHEEVRNLISNLVARLTPQQRQIFLLSREQNLKQELIAEKMGISVQTVKNHLTTALKFLREEIGRTYGPYAIALFTLHNLHLP